MKHINRNYVWGDGYSDNSFIGIFHEQREWNDDEYFKLENDLYELASEYSGDEVLPREVVLRVQRIFSYLMMSLGCHADPNDGFEINDISSDQHRSRTERIQLVFEGFFKGEMPEKEYLEY